LTREGNKVDLHRKGIDVKTAAAVVVIAAVGKKRYLMIEYD